MIEEFTNFYINITRIKKPKHLSFISIDDNIIDNVIRNIINVEKEKKKNKNEDLRNTC